MSTTTVTPPALPDADRRTRRDVLPWVSLAGRLLLAGVLVYAASSKLFDPLATVRAVRAYKILPEGLAVPFAHALPWVELGLALLLLAGVAVRLVGWLTAGLLTVFVIGMSAAWARGLKIDCGCFGGGGPTEHPQYLRDVLRDLAFVLVAVTVALVPRSRFAVDPSIPAEEPPEDPQRSARRERQARALQAARRRQAQARLGQLRWGALVALAVATVVGLVAGAALTPSPRTTPLGANSSGGIVVGSSTAGHRVLVYEDPQCPVCKTFEDRSGALLAQAVERGLVSVEYRMRSFLGPESVRAVAALGAAADEGRFEQLREQLFAHQPREQTGGYTIDDLLSLGQAAGLTSSEFQQKVRSQRYATWARTTDDTASRNGNIGTPELWLDGRKVPLEVMLQPAQFAQVLGL
jgi:protein-disulfide isomerase